MQHPKCRTCGKHHAYGPCPQPVPKFEDMPVVETPPGYIEDIRKSFKEVVTDSGPSKPNDKKKPPSSPVAGALTLQSTVSASAPSTLQFGSEGPTEESREGYNTYMREYMKKWRARKKGE